MGKMEWAIFCPRGFDDGVWEENYAIILEKGHLIKRNATANVGRYAECSKHLAVTRYFYLELGAVNFIVWNRASSWCREKEVDDALNEIFKIFHVLWTGLVNVGCREWKQS